MRLLFPKKENLKSRTIIAQLFSKGKSKTNYPVKLLYMDRPEADCTQAAFSVPKRNFGRAVDRNRLKRRMREAYRLNKTMLNTNNIGPYALLFLYIGKDAVAFEDISRAIEQLLKSLQK